ncbi:hypothetical protein J3R82DRAFT_7475 [Butyriboletus roseoflavus]|nr:hypothetical protein J3R82DRAFT_7475 [Butyriboletus roseoflavus]
MSAVEIIDSLSIEVDADLVVELDDQIAAADEIQALEDAPASGSKLALVGAGGTIYAKFSPGPSGSGPCNKKGTGAFVGSKSPSGLTGNYKLVVARLTVKLYQGSNLTWSGTGLQKGLSGSWDVKF